MIRVPPGAVILDATEADYVVRALEEFARLLAERRDLRGNPAPSRPKERLLELTLKLRRAVDSPAALVVTDKAADHRRMDQPPEGTASLRRGVRASQRAPVHGGRHDIGTGEAARRLGVTPNAVRDLARRQRIPATRTGTRWRFDAAAVDAYADGRRSSTRR
ncbi:helix-turn-helix domain-containing protein [Mycolicibacterium iranicum]|uniref:helix-turn-helix domain-containing protein n=1 Tax=Mycolicibacterium iranicum TaxID=912594 RepID=UPI000465679B|nr:helix-turn-helix domain-containing protein [Mycolicibacterium iranicum]